MKAFVIKNKEGKYCQITFNGWINFVSELCCAYIYHSKQGSEKIIKCHELTDCEVVPVTIAEGDLEQAIRKQVCDEIREKLKMNEYNTCENTAFGVHYDYLKEILNKIEKGVEYD